MTVPPAPIVYQDNHLLAVHKPAGLPVQADSSGDPSLLDLTREWLRVSCAKPGKAYLGLVHRLDRPVQGLVLFSKTDKALRRLNEAMRNRQLQRSYLAICEHAPPQSEGELEHYLLKNAKLNRSFAVTEDVSRAKLAKLKYRLIGVSRNYFLVKIELETGRHHQIRAQMAAVGAPIRGDVKYGASRTLAGGIIDLLSWQMCFSHPIGNHPPVLLQAQTPPPPLWQHFAALIAAQAAGSATAQPGC